TCETVVGETPAARATCLIVAMTAAAFPPSQDVPQHQLDAVTTTIARRFAYRQRTRDRSASGGKPANALTVDLGDFCADRRTVSRISTVAIEAIRSPVYRQHWVTGP